MVRKHTHTHTNNNSAQAGDDAARQGAKRGQRQVEAVESVRKMILSGELAPGQRLREVSLSEQLGMSRTPIREAFRVLSAEGLVSLLPNRSVVVTAPDASEAADVFRVLGALEALAGQLACKRMTDEQIEVLGELQEDLARHYKRADRLSYLEANRLIHEHIVESAHSPSLLLAWRLLLPRAERARHVSTLDKARWDEAFREHQEIYAAMKARDEAALKKLMQEHFQKGIRSMNSQSALERARERAKIYAAVR